MYKQVKISPTQICETGVLRVTDGMFIPFNADNTDYQNYLKWLDGYEMVNSEWVKTSDGNTPLPSESPNEGNE